MDEAKGLEVHPMLPHHYGPSATELTIRRLYRATNNVPSAVMDFWLGGGANEQRSDHHDRNHHESLHTDGHSQANTVRRRSHH